VKRYLGHIFLTILSCACFVFVYYTASRGLLFFEDSRLSDQVAGIETILKVVEEDGKEILRRLNLLASDDVIIHTLAQYELGESLEKGALALRRLANGISGCESLRLIGIDDTIVIDSASDALEGKPLKDDEKQRMRVLLRKPGSFEFFADGRAEAVVRCLSRAGMDVGILRVVLAPSFLTSRFYGGHCRASVVDGVVFLAEDGLLPKRDALTGLASEIRRNMQEIRTSDAILVPVRSGFSSQVFAGISSRDGQGLPGIAGQILVLNGLVIVALVLLLILRVINHWEHGRLELVRERIDAHESSMQEIQATAEDIIKATDTMYVTEEVEYHPEPETHVPEPVDEPSDEMPTLSAVLARSRQTPVDQGEFETRGHDDELQTIIDRVAFQQDVIPHEGENPEEDSVLAQDDSSGSGLDVWFEKIVAMLERSLDVKDVLLLENAGDGIYRVTQRSGFSAACDSACTLAASEKLFTMFLARHKVLFIRESALSNPNMKKRFPDVDPDEISQLAYIPVLKDGQILAILVFGCTGNGRGSLDQPALQEIQFLSML